LNRLVTGSLLLALCLLQRPALCEVQRFAVVIGNDRGQADDVELRYAASDADKVADVLRDIGGVQPANLVVLRNEDAATARSTLITFNDRIRSAQALPGTQTLLVVYYSGHADAQALRLGASRFEIDELTRLVRGSAATFRLLIVDACRSGSITRVKGGRIVPPFPLAIEARLQGEGMAFLTASSATEDAQESDELRGSFFSHAFVSGLLGVADADRDGAVTLEEAYRHAYDATLRATSRTFAGTQHPTFQFDMRGQEWVVLTRPGAADPNRAQLEFPKGLSFLVMAGSELGVVIGEVTTSDVGRKLSVRPGRYFVRGRASDALLEGSLDISAKDVRLVDIAELKRISYARLVRKGARESGLAHGPEVGLAVRTALPNAAGPCWGPVLGYRIELESLTLGSSVGVCTAGFENSAIEARTNEYSLSLGVGHVWDLASFSLAIGGGGGAVLTTQSFETRGSAPARTSASPLLFAGVAVGHDFSSRFYVALDARPEAHLLRLQDDASVEPKLRLRAVLRTAMLVGMRF